MKATQCSIENCEHGAPIVHGLCGTHYARMRRRGNTDRDHYLPLAERLAAGLERKLNGCLEWTGGTNSSANGEGGYGVISDNYKTLSTHRASWILANGPIPEGLWVLHHCDNRICCQTDPTEGYPDGHLFLGTRADNMADMIAKGRSVSCGISRKTHTRGPRKD